MFCKYCGKEVSFADVNCQHCGGVLREAPVQQPQQPAAAPNPVKPHYGGNNPQFGQSFGVPSPMQPNHGGNNPQFGQVGNTNNPQVERKIEYRIPSDYEPLSPWAYFGLQMLFSIPIVGFIMLIVFSCNDNNVNRQNFAKSYWCSLIVGAVAFVILLFCGALESYF